MTTRVSITVNLDGGDMTVIDLGNVELSAGTFRLVNLKLGSVGVLISSDMVDQLDRLGEIVEEARSLLTHEPASSRGDSSAGNAPTANARSCCADHAPQRTGTRAEPSAVGSA